MSGLTKKVILNHKNADGVWEALYPRTLAEQVVTSEVHRFVSDTQIESWNSKATSDVASQTANGLISAQDKVKLDGIAVNANNYALPQATADLLGGIKGGTNVTIVDGTLNIADGSTTAKGVVQLNSDITSTSETTAASSAAVKAVNDKVTTHVASEEVHITALERSNWNAKASTAVATQVVNGLLSATDKVIIDGLDGRFTAMQGQTQTLVTQAVEGILDGAPAAFDTLKEISDYIGSHQTEYDALLALTEDKVSKSSFDTAVNELIDAVDLKADADKIYSHAVSAEEPTNLVNGAIWFQEVS